MTTWSRPEEHHRRCSICGGLGHQSAGCPARISIVDPAVPAMILVQDIPLYGLCVHDRVAPLSKGHPACFECLDERKARNQERTAS